MRVPEIRQAIKEQAEKQYPIHTIVQRYMECIEEVINLPILLECLQEIIKTGDINLTMDEIVKHSRVEFHIAE